MANCPQPSLTVHRSVVLLPVFARHASASAAGCGRNTPMQLLASRQPRDVRWGVLLKHSAKWAHCVDSVVVLVFIVLLLVWGFLVFVIGMYTSPTMLGCLLSLQPNCTINAGGGPSAGDGDLDPILSKLLTFVSPLFLTFITTFLQQVRMLGGMACGGVQHD